MVNTQLLKDHVAKYKFTKDSAAELHKQLFTLYPELAKYWDAEDLDPDQIPKAQKFQRLGMGEIRALFNMAGESGDEHGFIVAVSEVAEYYKDMDFPLQEFDKFAEAIVNAMKAQAGGCTDEQATAWRDLIKKAHDIMRERHFD